MFPNSKMSETDLIGRSALKQAYPGLPHSEILVELDNPMEPSITQGKNPICGFILQAKKECGKCTELHLGGGTLHRKNVHWKGGTLLIPS